jgi:hypothetical protein
MGIARNRKITLGLRAVERDLGDLARQHGHACQLFLQPQPRGDQDLVVAAAAGVDLAACVAEALGQPRFDGGVAVFEALVQHEVAAAEILGQRREFALQSRQFVAGQDAGALQTFGMRGAGLDVVQEELAVQHHVVAGEETLDLRVHRHAGFLPQQVRHRVSPPEIADPSLFPFSLREKVARRAG